MLLYLFDPSTVYYTPCVNTFLQSENWQLINLISGVNAAVKKKKQGLYCRVIFLEESIINIEVKGL